MLLESQTKSLYNFIPCWAKNELGPLLIFEKHTLGFYLFVLYIYIYIYIYISPSFIQFSLSAALKEKIYQQIQEKIYQQIPRQINNIICQQEKKSSKIFKKKFKINQDCIRNLPAIKKKIYQQFLKKKSRTLIIKNVPVV